MNSYEKPDNEIDLQIKKVVQRLREEREKAKISQLDLSFEAGLSQNQVNYIETGKRKPNLVTLLKICNALNISPALLFAPLNDERQNAKETILNLVSKYI